MVASREILWNVNSLSTNILMYGLFALALVIGAAGVIRHAELWLSGKPAPERERAWFQRFVDLYTWGLLQQGVVRERIPAIAHSLIYIGFLVLLFTTTMVFIDNDLGIRIYQGEFYLAVTIFSDVLGFGVLIGCLMLAHRRYLARADLLHSRQADSLMLASLALLIIQGFVLEGLRIHVTRDPWALYSPIGLLVAKFFWPLTPSAASNLHFITWWFHTLTVFVLVALAPYTKFFHLIASSANLFFRFTSRPRGALPYPGDLEQLMESGEEFSLGTSSIKDYSWKALLDLDACTSCGRCQSVCPAYNSGKPLSPKWLILDTRNHALALSAQGKLAPSILPRPLRALDSQLTTKFFLASSGVTANGTSFSSSGAFRGANTAVQESALPFGISAEQKICGEVMKEDVFWSCTTCMACVEACPVGINHVDQIIENRRAKVLMEGSLPHEAQRTLRVLESSTNPFTSPDQRANWAKGLDVRVVGPGDSVDYLYWVGCISSFDQRKQRIAQSLVKIMRAANLDFGILGNAECCTGDPARRIGEENLFQSLAKRNIETLRAIKFKTLVANCPHCFNTILNEYPQIGSIATSGAPPVIHHSQLIRRLIKKGKLNLRAGFEQSITFHDPCYLGRYNDEYDAPRETLASVSRLPILEMEANRQKGMCCGAGGGHYWMDLKAGERINVIRAEHAAATGAKIVATACPFCMQMMEDGLTLTNRSESMQVRDIAEVVAEAL